MIGDKVIVKTKDKDYEGILMPEDKGNIVLKLDSGYNIGIDKKDIKQTKVSEKAKEQKTNQEKIKQNSKLPKISILHTGGTIASKVDYRTGGVVSTFNPEDLLSMFPELNAIANFDSKLISNMFSDDLRFCHFEKIAKSIEKEAKKGVKGVIVGMGTDNLAVASAAVAFAFEEINIPVIFVGAQRSSDRGSSDAAMNLICAAEFIAKENFKGVALCMHSTTDDNKCSILPATKTRKLHSSRRDAFRVVNDIEIATIDYKTRKISFVKKNHKQLNDSTKLVVKSKFEEKVGIIKIHVNMFPEQFDVYQNFKGLIIEGTGLGHTPGDEIDECTKIHSKIKASIKKLTDKGVIVVMTTQCIFGRVDMNVYSKGRDLQELGVIPGQDMLAETALVKLAWLLANEKRPKELVQKNIRGEITKCTDINSHL